MAAFARLSTARGDELAKNCADMMETLRSGTAMMGGEKDCKAFVDFACNVILQKKSSSSADRAAAARLLAEAVQGMPSEAREQ